MKQNRFDGYYSLWCKSAKSAKGNNYLVVYQRNLQNGQTNSYCFIENRKMVPSLLTNGEIGLLKRFERYFFNPINKVKGIDWATHESINGGKSNVVFDVDGFQVVITDTANVNGFSVHSDGMYLVKNDQIYYGELRK